MNGCRKQSSSAVGDEVNKRSRPKSGRERMAELRARRRLAGCESMGVDAGASTSEAIPSCIPNDVSSLANINDPVLKLAAYICCNTVETICLTVSFCEVAETRKTEIRCRENGCYPWASAGCRM